jgi:hypothetical protein
MFYRPTQVAKMWDTWLYYHQGVHYLYYLHETTGARFDGMSVATSTDGVHFTEIGSIVEARADAQWLGTGSVWQTGGRFVMNYSEQRQGVQAIFFMQSTDLIHWDRLGDEVRSDPDPRWYDDTPAGRWDCIWALRRPQGGFWGYLTARPWSHTPGLRFESVGMVESDDGLHWRAVAPPIIEWGDWPRMDVGEVGAIEQIGDRYYLMLGFGETGLGNRHALRPLEGRFGMYIFVGDDPRGPFTVDTRAYRLLTSITGIRMSYFARFYPTPDGMLVNHHAISRSDVRWLAPLKRAVLDKDGHLYLGYWAGNDAAQGKPIDLDLGACVFVCPDQLEPGWVASRQRLTVDVPHGGALALFANHFDLEKGVIVQGSMQVHAPPKRWSGIGVYIEEDARLDTGTAVLAQTRGCTEIGPLRDAQGRTRFVADDALPLGVQDGAKCSFRLLVRRSLLEFYLDDRLVQCYSLPGRSSGRLGLVVESGRALFEGLRAWEMNDL